MFCSQCAHELTPSDVYCPSCAKPVASFNFDPGRIPQVERIDDETPTVVRPSVVYVEERRGTGIGKIIATIALGIVILFAIGLVAFIAYRTGLNARKADNGTAVNAAVNRGNATPSPTPMLTVTPNPTPDLPKNLIVNSVFAVGPGELQYFEFDTTQPAKVTGGFRTTDGGSKDVDVYIVDEQNMIRVTEKDAFKSLYIRSKAERGKIDVQVGPGKYFVVFSNRHALLTGKEVAAEIYYQER